MINTEPIGYDFLPSTTVLAAMKLGPFAIGRVTMAGWHTALFLQIRFTGK